MKNKTLEERLSEKEDNDNKKIRENTVLPPNIIRTGFFREDVEYIVKNNIHEHPMIVTKEQIKEVFDRIYNKLNN